ncbi:DUF6527 family protein [Shumkonia mesophila]|uniref:DUF6527 family protein n=1 Tax=Shumkonia mesophila TaxID=2838854 RepID=UPI003742300A
MWRDLLRQTLVLLRLIRRPDFVAHVSKRHPTPDEMLTGVIVVVQDGRHQKWACLRCPGGCGERLQLSLNPTRRPHWAITLDWLRRPSVTPSVRQLTACRCHFWIKDGIVEWCADSGRQP